MSTGVVTRPRPQAPHDSPRAQRALARFESARVLGHPAFLTAVLLYAALWAYEAWGGGPRGRYPVLQDEDRYTQLPLLLLAAGALVATNLTTTRLHRSGTQPLAGVLGLPPWRRTLAHLTTALPPAALAALLATARIAAYATSPTAVGSPSPAELATGPAVVLLAGCAGVTLARLTPSAASGPYAVLLLGVLVLCGALGVRGLKWAGPVGVEDEFAAPLPGDLMHRPVAEHLVYLAAVTGVLALLALVRTGVRAAPVRVALVVLAGTAVVAGVLQYRPLPDDVVARRADAELHPGDRQRCRVADRVTFCAFPEFLARSRDWQRVTDGILTGAPATEGPYAVRQRIFLGADHDGAGQDGVAGMPPLEAWARDDDRHGTPGAVTVGTAWGTDDTGGDEMLAFAVRFADRVVPGHDPSGGGMLCRARAVTVLWLAAQATPQTADALRSIQRRSVNGVTLDTLGSSQALGFGAPEVQVVRDLLDLPAPQVADRLKASWPALADERTSTGRAARLLGVTAPPDAEQGAEDTRCDTD
ncbi:ABC transporter permease [Streptomyces acidiscabies]|uniref:ABC transporter permease n=1 Tax=Streptomyces acidiscabies TaxID=42234 RepID=UPI0030D5F439